MGWAESFERLVAHGHRHADILDYTLGQFDAYLRLVAHRERGDLRSLILAARLGGWGSQEQIATILQQLQD